MEFRDYVRQEVRSTRGIEIGPSYRPIAAKRDGFKTVIIDHASAEDLKTKYSDRSENVELTEHVDVVWREGTLEKSFDASEHGTFEWIIASHVIEHVPDIITFLQSCETLLSPTGRLFLAVPDKRRTFDFVKSPLDISLAMERFQEKRTRHAYSTVFSAYNDHVIVGKGRRGDWGVLPIDTIQLASNPISAKKIADESHDAAEYFDCHANYLTPASFGLLLLEMRFLGLTSFDGDVRPTQGCEFFAELQSGTQSTLSLEQYQQKKTRYRIAMFEEIEDQIRRLKESDKWRDYASIKDESVTVSSQPASSSAKKSIMGFLRRPKSGVARIDSSR
ncbi:class I SAM-dependent methyltransferase [Agrobacterium rosae]|nr:methyltransferase domain-containing protein [Agrobacterium rosae]